ncbi:MAG: sulfide:quinone oxidoreductase [Sulfurimonas sp.]|jgi:sulfide:quinone oxidoreductase|uniref:NAD(P)/FAD-dependent oxidoreductase n=1 Tax=Sulfurimonas sp. TaxID=2022749 RepID=UPI0039E2F35A
MDTKNFLNNYKSDTELSRRDAIKLMGISPIAASVLASAGTSSIAEASADVSGKVIIVGGGAGALMALSRIKRAIKNPDITIIAPNEAHLYQPGQVFIGAGEMEMEDIILDNNNYIDPDEVTWVKDAVKAFDPDNNTVTTRAGKELKYDYLVVATGAQYNYEDIEGLTKEDIGKNGITSVYLSDLEKGTSVGATATWEWNKALKIAATTSKQKQKVIFTHPNTKIKCGGAPQKVLHLTADYLKKDGLSAEYTFVTSTKTLFPLPHVAKALEKVQAGYDTISHKFQHHLQSIDVQNKKATFLHSYSEDVYDEEFGESETVSHEDTVIMDYDFIHITPPMSAITALMNSKLVDFTGWLEVDKYTLQHKRYSNVFGIGDTCGIPMGKTGGSARHQGPILTENLISVMKNEKAKAIFDGYTVCPIKTAYGQILMAEFNYAGDAPTIPFLSIAEPRAFWWLFDLYQLKPMYQYLMLTGRF